MLKKDWHLVCEFFKEVSTRLYQVLKKANVSLEEFTIKLLLPGQHVIDMLEQKQTNLLEAIHEVYGNKFLKIETQLDKTENKTTKLLLSKDKLNYFIQKNKEFDLLITRLSLDVF